MRERPIILTDWQVRAVLAGTKTQHRVVTKNMPPPPDIDAPLRHPPKHTAPYFDAYCSAPKTEANPRGMSDHWCWWTRDDRQCLPTIKAPYAPGDRLWVRETWGHDAPDLDTCRRGVESDGPPHGPYCRADCLPSDRDQIKWRSPVTMPRWASRITLTVLSVRAERLQDISDADAMAEGVWREFRFAVMRPDGGPDYRIPNSHRGGFANTWPGKGPASWDANPWVWVLGFEKENGDA